MDETVDFLEDYMEFGENRVYLLMAIARKNENEGITNSQEIVFREVVKNKKDISRKVEKLRNSVDNYGEAEKFRLYASANARNTLDAYWSFRDRMNSWIKDYVHGDDAAPGKLKRIDKHWKSELQRDSSRDETKFLWDLDEPEEEKMEELKETLEKHTEVQHVRQTPNGWHIITEPFNFNEMETPDMDIERKTDTMIFMEMIQE